MILCIDSGNSRIKWGLHDGGAWSRQGVLEQGAAEQLAALEFPIILKHLKNVDEGIMPALSTYQIGFAGGYHHGDTWFHQGTSDRHIVQAEKAIDLALSFTNMNLVQRGKQMVSHGINRLLMDHEMLLRKIQSDVSNIS